MKDSYGYIDYSYEWHQNCPYFVQNAWMMSEDKYICLKNPNELYWLMEIPEGCIKGFKAYHFPEPPKMIEDKTIIKEKPKCKIYEFKLKEQNQ